jgi:predicted tellurium resistance membrane protein TerC
MDVLSSLTDFSWMSNPGAWVGLFTLILLEVVLGIDNIVFISILAGKLPPEQQQEARKKGLIFAVIPRLVFLLLIGVIISLQNPFFHLPIPDPGGHSTHPKGYLGISGKDLVLIVGGLFLLIQAVREIHHNIEPEPDSLYAGKAPRGALTMKAVLVQIMFMNIIFSLDSIITAIGMVKEVPVMILAVLISTWIMIYAVTPISNFVQKHPTVKMLALAFLLLIGTNLLAEAVHFHIPKGYVYFAMAFSVFVEVLNIRAKNKHAKAQP